MRMGRTYQHRERASKQSVKRIRRTVKSDCAHGNTPEFSHLADRSAAVVCLTREWAGAPFFIGVAERILGKPGKAGGRDGAPARGEGARRPRAPLRPPGICTG